MSANAVARFWRRVTTFFGVEAIAFAREHRGRETTQARELAALRSEVDDLKRRLSQVERTSAPDR